MANQFDKNCATWHLTKKYLLRQQQELRAELENIALTHDQTLVIRGQLLTIYSLLNDGEKEISKINLID